MNKLQAKHLYILLVAIFSIVAVSIYSTYAIFTLESRSDNIVTIRTPDALHISSSIYEYKQVTVPKDAYIETDIDIYNNFNYELCYSIWYKTTGSVKIYENTNESLTTSSTIAPVTGKRIKLLIINDNDTDTKVNIGVVSEKNEGTCALNISSDKALISSTINAKSLSVTAINNNTNAYQDAGYLTYKDNESKITLAKDNLYYVATNFTYQDELFTLTEPTTIDFTETKDYQNYYLCLSGDNCKTIYHITEIARSEENYVINKYDTLTGYLAGDNGLRKINNDYYYFGDNPHNFIYYNCANEVDTKSCELWRILGFTYDEANDKYLTKIIRNDYLTKRIFDETKNVWNGSNIAKYFEEEYKPSGLSLFEERTFKVKNITSLDNNIADIVTRNDEIKAKVMLMDVYDYLYASTCEKAKFSEYDNTCLMNNWLNKGETEWTMTTKYEEKKLDEETNEEIIPDNNTVYAVGNEITDVIINNELLLRPVAYLKTRALVTAGDGTLDNPYIIK